MADIAQSLKSWSSTLGSNLPTSSSTIGTGLAPNLQQIQSTLRYELGSRSASITALATTDIGVQDEGTILILNASGTVAITSFGIVSAGIKKLVTFNVTGGVLSLTYNASSMILPSVANINVLTGDSLLAESLGAGNWKIHAYYKNDGSSITGIAISAIQTQLYTAFNTAGISTAYTLTPSPALTALTTNSRFNVLFNVAPTGSPTLAVSGLTAKSIKYYDATGAKQFITAAQVPINWDTDVIYDGTDWVVQTTVPLSVTSKVQSVTATQTTGALTFGLAASVLDYRSTTLTTGATTTVTNAALSLVLPSGSTLGFSTTVQGRAVLVALNNAGTAELAVISLAGGNSLDETGLISTTAISAGSTANNVFYSTTARTSVAYHVVGFVDAVNTAGAWATPVLVQGMGGNTYKAIPTPSMVRLNTANGYGSTNTVIRRFTNTITNQGTDITYADSATLGASFTINTNGFYAISANYSMGGANANTGISLNSSQLTTAIQSINISDRLANVQTYSATANTSCGWVGYLVSGAIIRPHEDGSASSNINHIFTIARVA